ncbi:MAG: GPW/gp25 family protein [Pseudomonadota bacterium]
MNPATIAFPFSVAARGSLTPHDRVLGIRAQMEQILFTRPGERVGRPEFGCGIDLLVFAASDDQTAAAAELAVMSSLTQGMDGLVQIDAVRARTEAETLIVDILFTTLDDSEEFHVDLSFPLGEPR